MNNKILSLSKFKKLPQYETLPVHMREEFDIVSNIFLFKSNQYLIDTLINWKNVSTDPIYRINFPNKDMLHKEEYTLLQQTIREGKCIDSIVKNIRYRHIPAAIQKPTRFIPMLYGKRINGFLHQYPKTLVAMIKPAKTCFANCSYCLVWPIHVMGGFEYGYVNPVIPAVYLEKYEDVSDIFFTGGDTLRMSASLLIKFITPLLKVRSLQTIRIATKALSWWPYRFIDDADSSELLDFFEKIKQHNKKLTLIAHISHPIELSTPQAKLAIKKIQSTGTVIRTQTPLLRKINDSIEVLETLLKEEIRLGLIPYYVFTDANAENNNSFKIPLIDAFSIYSGAMKKVTGLVKTVHGPVITHNYCKIEIAGLQKINESKHFILKCLQSPDQSKKGMIATIPYDPQIVSLDGIDLPFYENNSSSVQKW